MSINESDDDISAPLSSFAGDPEEDEASGAAKGSEGVAPIRPMVFSGERRSARQLWLISYADFMTILMIFFLAMYGYTYLAKTALIDMGKKKMSYSEFTERVQDIQKKIGDQMKVQDDTDKVVVQLSDQILFPSGSAALSAAASSPLEELANSIKLIDGEVIVQGHTDDIPVRAGRFKSNWELSAARAFSVIAALTSQGVGPERLAAWGFGENRPLADNSTMAGRAQNRRIEVVILKKKQKAGANQ